MRLSELVTETRIALDADSNAKWTTAKVVAAINGQQRSMIRKMVELDEAYFNHSFVLLKTAARAVRQSIWSFRIPSWVDKISSIRQSLGTGSAYARGPVIPRCTKWDDCGWRHSAVNEVQLVGFSAAVDIDLEVAKIPARMTQGILPAQAGITSSQMKLDADPAPTSDYPHETVQGSYAGALFEITGPASVRVGQLLRCIGSANDPAGTIITMEEAWTSAPNSGDTYEMHAELPTQHTRLLVLLAARTLLAAERNIEGIGVLRDELNEQWRLFLDTIAYRDISQPHTVVESLPATHSLRTSYQDEYQ